MGVRVGMIHLDEECENAVPCKNFKPMTEEEEKYFESADWVDLSTLLGNIEEVRRNFKKFIDDGKEYLTKTMNENNVDEEVDLDFRGLDVEVDKIINNVIVDLKYAKGNAEE